MVLHMGYILPILYFSFLSNEVCDSVMYNFGFVWILIAIIMKVTIKKQRADLSTGKECH